MNEKNTPTHKALYTARPYLHKHGHNNTTNTAVRMINNTSKIERAVPCLLYDEADIMKDILADLNHQAKAEPHRTMESILNASPYNSKWKAIIGYEGRKFLPTIKIERRKNKIINNINN